MVSTVSTYRNTCLHLVAHSVPDCSNLENLLFKQDSCNNYPFISIFIMVTNNNLWLSFLNKNTTQLRESTTLL